MSDKIVELDITDLAFDGKSVAHLDGKVVFLRGGLPGEKVQARITRIKPRYNEGRVIEILEKSSDRIDAICEHFDICGGCTWQDLDYQKQLDYKTKQVRDCMERLAKLPDVVVHDTLPSADQFFYRNKMEYSFNVTDDGGFTLGLHHRGSWADVFDVHQCHLMSEASNRAIEFVRDFVKERKIPVYDVQNHHGFMRFLMMRETKKTNQLMVNIITNYGDLPYEEEWIEGLKSTLPELTTIVHNQNGQKSNIATGEVEKILFGLGYIEEEIMGKRFRISSNSFFQTNPVQAERLYQAGFDLLPEKINNVLDLYCGTGTIGLSLADRVEHVTGVELVGDAIKAARENAELNDISNVEFIEANATDYLRNLENEDNVFDLIILDPPRAGLHPKALKRIMKMNPPGILYISCNPATFARDVAQLVGHGYAIGEVRPVDMFPHTMHIEVVAYLSRLAPSDAND